MINYEIIDCIGFSSNGNKVYSVKHKFTSMLYVMKIIETTEDEDKKKDVNNEVNILKSINSKYIIKYFDSFFNNQKTFLIMEYAEKGDLDKYIKLCLNEERFIPEELIWKWGFQLIDSLIYLYNKKILHRDIKVHNVFITKENNIKLGDFGISKQQNTLLDSTNSTLGTPFYLPPEICFGKNYSFKSEIWMLGCLLYELMNLKKPFSGESFPSIINSIKNTFPDMCNKDIYSSELSQFILFLLEKDVEVRPSLEDICDNEYFKQVYCQSNHNDLVNINQFFNENTLKEKEKEKKKGNQTYVKTLVNKKLVISIKNQKEKKIFVTPNFSKQKIYQIHKKMDMISPMKLENKVDVDDNDVNMKNNNSKYKNIYYNENFIYDNNNFLNPEKKFSDEKNLILSNKHNTISNKDTYKISQSNTNHNNINHKSKNSILFYNHNQYYPKKRFNSLSKKDNLTSFNSTDYNSLASPSQLEPSPLNSNFVYFKKNLSNFKKDDLTLISGNKHNSTSIKNLNSKNFKHFKHISMNISSTIDDPTQSVEFEVSIEKVKNLKFGKS